MWDLTLEQGVGVPSIFASLHATALALELHDTAPTNGQKNLGQLFARFLTELLTEADGQLVGWTTRQAAIWAQICKMQLCPIFKSLAVVRCAININNNLSSLSRGEEKENYFGKCRHKMNLDKNEGLKS